MIVILVAPCLYRCACYIPAPAVSPLARVERKAWKHNGPVSNAPSQLALPDAPSEQ